MTTLEELAGVGPQLAHKIRTAFRTEAAFFEAAQRMDLAAVAKVDGISERRAVDLLLAARGDATHDQFYGTTAARRIHDRIMQRLLRYANTDVGRNRLRLLHPLPSKEAATASIQQVMAAKEQVRDADPAMVRRNLRALQAAPKPTPILDTALLVVAESDAAYDQLHAIGVHHWATLGTPRDLEQADAYDVVVIAYDDGGIDASSLAHAIDVPADAPLEQHCPHALLGSLADLQPALEACAQLASTFNRATVAGQLLPLLANASTDGPSATDVRAAVERLKLELDSELETRVAGLSLSGPELLRAMARGGLPPALQSSIDDVLRRARDDLRVATGIAFQPYTSSLPLGIDDDEVDRVIGEMEHGRTLERFQRNQSTATEVARLLPDLQDEIRSWLEFDATFALGRFALEHGLGEPTWSEQLSFDSSVHLDLAHSTAAQRISYRLGGTENVAVLTGANSGGKSTLLEHMAQIVVMARLGLPVVGTGVQVPWMDEVHLVTARRGMDAGAFETFLRGFLPVTNGDARRLVLADEVESITELEAAGRIIAFVLDRLAATDSLAVIVTHLAPQVLTHVTAAKVRVDGIEATGLDDNHRLIVDRCPKMGRAARSTPELIIQRLAATTKGKEQTLYADLLECFNGQHP